MYVLSHAISVSAPGFLCLQQICARGKRSTRPGGSSGEAALFQLWRSPAALAHTLDVFRQLIFFANVVIDRINPRLFRPRCRERYRPHLASGEHLSTHPSPRGSALLYGCGLLYSLKCDGASSGCQGCRRSHRTKKSGLG